MLPTWMVPVDRSRLFDAMTPAVSSPARRWITWWKLRDRREVGVHPTGEAWPRRSPSHVARTRGCVRAFRASPSKVTASSNCAFENAPTVTVMPSSRGLGCEFATVTTPVGVQRAGGVAIQISATEAPYRSRWAPGVAQSWRAETCATRVQCKPDVPPNTAVVGVVMFVAGYVSGPSAATDATSRSAPENLDGIAITAARFSATDALREPSQPVPVVAPEGDGTATHTHTTAATTIGPTNLRTM